jgi:precorrin-8X/cobalt-precorrin-8 methylmutase
LQGDLIYLRSDKVETIILVGHGSRRKEANNLGIIGGLLHELIHPGCSDNCVKVAYLQFSRPTLMEAIRDSVQHGASRVIIHPYFLSTGNHVTQDIPSEIEEARRHFTGVEFIYTEPLGVHNKLVEVVLERIHSARPTGPEDIEKRSLQIIDGEIDMSDVPPEQVPIIKRVIHATADFEFKHSLVFHKDAIPRALEAVRAGADILTDIEMVRVGINKRALQKWGGKVYCHISDPEVVQSAKRNGRTRAEVAIEHGLRDNVGIIVIGNAPTALLRIIEMFNSIDASAKTPVVIGVPVGFVNAIESKALLATQSFPFITNLSKKGGTAVAVAIVNALLKMA